MKIVKVKITDIVPYENNAKLHPQEQIEQIKNSILEFGNNDPIAIDENNVIIEGHGRYEALKELGYEEAEVIQLTNLSEDQKNAYRLVHNQLTMNTDFDIDMLKSELSKIDIDMSKLGIDENLLNEIEDNALEAVDDDFDIDEAMPETPSSIPGQVWELGEHRLMCGDSTQKEDVMHLMNGQHADLLLTDPPYNINVSNSQGMTIDNDNLEKKEFVEFLTKVFKNANDSLAPGASFYIWYGDTSASLFYDSLAAAEMEVRENLIWVKSQFILGRQDYHWRHEPCLYGWKAGAGHYFVNDRTQSTVFDESIDLDTIPEDKLRDYIKDLINQSTIFYENKPMTNDLHPTMKPIRLMGRMIKNSSKPKETVLDLFGGSGSTLIACEQLNRRCLMMEYDPKYCDVIIKRWEEFTGRKAVLLNDG